ncbi:flagellar basal body rod protein FlgC [bacterium]|nr:flagellar basal body rod protein FlgC [bacterium]
MSIMNSMEIGRRGLQVHGKRIEISAKNIANLDTPNYVRKIPVIKENTQTSFKTMLDTGLNGSNAGGVTFEGTVQDPTPLEKVYMPGHPDADEHGYVKMSNSNPMVEIADASMAQRAYEASISVMSMAKSMALKALEIGQ